MIAEKCGPDAPVDFHTERGALAVELADVLERFVGDFREAAPRAVEGHREGGRARRGGGDGGRPGGVIHGLR